MATVLYNLNRIINTNDKSFIDYTQGETKAYEPLQPLNTLFSDNIVVFMPLDDKLIKDIEKIKDKMNKENKNKNIATNEDDEDETPNKVLVRIAQRLEDETTNDKSINACV